MDAITPEACSFKSLIGVFGEDLIHEHGHRDFLIVAMSKGEETHELSLSKLVIPEFLSTTKTGKKLFVRRLTISRKNSKN